MNQSKRRHYGRQPVPVLGDAATMLADLLRESSNKRDNRVVR